MISYVAGNLFESPAQTLVNTVNTVGVMGKGIAHSFKAIYPEMFREYQELCETGKLNIGGLYLYRTPHKLILNFPTKKHWRNPSRPEYIEAGLETFVAIYGQAGIHSVAFPPLGCGNGELDFGRQVRPLMERYLSDLPIPVYVYAPHPRVSAPEHRVPEETRRWLRSAPTFLAFSEVWTDLERLLSRRRRFHTLARKSEIEVERITDDGGLRIRTPSGTVLFARDEIRELWKQLRTFGLVSARDVPLSRDKDLSYVLPVLAELPYVEQVALSDEYGEFRRSPRWGLQLVPQKGEVERPETSDIDEQLPLPV